MLGCGQRKRGSLPQTFAFAVRVAEPARTREFTPTYYLTVTELKDLLTLFYRFIATAIFFSPEP